MLSWARKVGMSREKKKAVVKQYGVRQVRALLKLKKRTRNESHEAIFAGRDVDVKIWNCRVFVFSSRIVLSRIGNAAEEKDEEKLCGTCIKLWKVETSANFNVVSPYGHEICSKWSGHWKEDTEYRFVKIEKGKESRQQANKLWLKRE